MKNKNLEGGKRNVPYIINLDLLPPMQRRAPTHLNTRLNDESRNQLIENLGRLSDRGDDVVAFGRDAADGRDIAVSVEEECYCGNVSLRRRGKKVKGGWGVERCERKETGGRERTLYVVEILTRREMSISCAGWPATCCDSVHGMV